MSFIPHQSTTNQTPLLSFLCHSSLVPWSPFHDLASCLFLPWSFKSMDHPCNPSWCADLFSLISWEFVLTVNEKMQCDNWTAILTWQLLPPCSCIPCPRVCLCKLKVFQTVSCRENIGRTQVACFILFPISFVHIIFFNSFLHSTFLLLFLISLSLAHFSFHSLPFIFSYNVQQLNVYLHLPSLLLLACWTMHFIALQFSVKVEAYFHRMRTSETIQLP